MERTILLFLTCLLFTLGMQGQNRPGKEDRKRGKLPGNEVILRNAISINTPSMEFAPVPYQNGLVYVTSRKKFGPRDQNTGETYYELFFAERDPDGMPVHPQPFSIELNSPMHENSVAFNHRGDHIFLTRNNMVNGLTRADSKGVIRMKIYEADRGPFDWINLRELPFNSDEYSCLHPTISPDETKLFFSSDMPGGYGGFDLWFVIKEGETWSAPINLGPGVNTSKNEVFPFMHASNTLFFSSDGYRGEGGLDIFMIDMSTSRWGEAINLGQPFNSPADDLSLILDREGRFGFFASNREGGFGKDDIYAFEVPDGIRGVKEPERLATILAVRDEGTRHNLTGADIRIYEQASDGYIDDQNLYDVQLMPSGTNTDSMVLKYVLKNEEELGPPKTTSNRAGEAWLNLEAGQSYLILVSKPGYHTFQLSYLRPMERGNDAVEVLLKPDQCINLDGIAFSDLGRQPVPNVRLRILNETTGETAFVQSKMNGKFEYCLESGCDYTLYAEKDGFRQASTRITTVKLRGSRSLNIEMTLKADSTSTLSEPLREGTVIVLEDLFYDFNKSSIRTQEARALEGLVKLMEQYPSMEIELGAHTDCRGSADYNLKLSLRRSESVKDYLVQHGIATHRVKTFGYGESKPRNHCRDGIECSEEEHQFNRRTEVTITRMKEPVKVDYRGRQLEDEVLGNKGDMRK